MHNVELRQQLTGLDVRMWQLADELNVTPSTLSIWLRRELTDEKKARVDAALKKILEERRQAV